MCKFVCGLKSGSGPYPKNTRVFLGITRTQVHEHSRIYKYNDYIILIQDWLSSPNEEEEERKSGCEIFFFEVHQVNFFVVDFFILLSCNILQQYLF